MGKHSGIAFLVPGTFQRFPIHMSTITAWHDLGLPKPNLAVGTSAGILALTSCLPWTNDNFKKANSIVGDLTPDQIFTLHPRIKKSLYSLAGSSVGVSVALLASLFMADKLSKKQRAVLAAVALGSLVFTERMVGLDFINTPAILSNDPLRQLLLSSLDFKGIFESSTRLEILVTDMNKPGSVTFSNQDKDFNDPDNPIHRERLVDCILATAGLPGRFKVRPVDGLCLTDGEVWTDFPIHRAQHYRKVFHFCYWDPLQPASCPETWGEDMVRAFDIARDKNHLEKRKRYEEQRRKDPDLPEVFDIKVSPELMKKLPNLVIHKFTPDDMKQSMNVGYAIILENEQRIREYLRS